MIIKYAELEGIIQNHDLREAFQQPQLGWAFLHVSYQGP